MKLRKIGGPKRQSLGLSGLRTIKMMVPTCEECSDPQFAKPRWWETCEHDPYYTVTEREVTTPIRETKDGETLITGHKTKIVEERSPNLRQVPLVERVNSGRELEQRRKQGWILPDEHPTDPLAPFCQYHECWSQDLTVKSRYGDFCDENQARMCGLDALGKPIKVNGTARARQLAEVWI